jgi:hypothetical protein
MPLENPIANRCRKYDVDDQTMTVAHVEGQCASNPMPRVDDCESPAAPD